MITLDPTLAQRTRRWTDLDPLRDREFVVYWMRTAVRAHDNPALEVALRVANALDLPLFVYHALSERYPYASDRHHRFVLEGARDVAQELAARGIGYAFHLERQGHRGPHLRTLTARAALVVTEEMPVAPLRGWTEALAKSRIAPVWCVDTACLVPMIRVGKAYDRAFAFREATAQLRAEALDTEWVAVTPQHPSFVPTLPFAPIELANADLGALIAECEIDHSVAPVPGTPGGSLAGYARWAEFCDSGGLQRYDRTRNDPLRDGSSRMSAYLHYGHVSPFRLAREANAIHGTGAQKYLDELAVWRDLAYAHCFYRPHHADYDDLPAWAKQTLAAHAGDPRDAVLSWETLARGRTGDALWDAAQDSLRIHGELHNNVRMTWGKALLRWAETPQRALRLAIDLNHRYALDGRDPASYGGILWCFGALDRAFAPAQPIYGTVRPRPTAVHAERLDVAGYAARTRRAAIERPPRIAIVGGGVAGLSCARTLQDHGVPVTVFDKGRAPGGRSSTRRSDDGAAFDHGAPFFTSHDARLAPLIASWRRDGLIARWEVRCVTLRPGTAPQALAPIERFVGVPGMSAIGRHLADDLEIARETAIESVDATGHLVAGSGARFGPFDAVVIAVPAPQAVPLLARAPSLARRAAAIEFEPCLAALLELAQPVELDFDAAQVEGSPLSWLARDDSKPGRASRQCWVLHGAPDWSRQHFDDAPETIARDLLDAFAVVTGTPLRGIVTEQVHRWRYARPTVGMGIEQSCLFDATTATGVCGDWCEGPGIEAAMLSGAALASRLLAWASDRRLPRQASLFGEV